MRRPFAVLAVSLVALAVTCKSDGGTAASVPTSVTVSPGAVTLSAIGATQALTATVRDQNNNVMTGQGIVWTSLNEAVATVTAGGVVTAVANGTATISAAVGTVQGSITVTVAQAPATVTVLDGNNQTGLVGFALNVRPAVIVRDAASAPIVSRQVAFAVTAGGGSVTGATVLTGVDGVARVGSWVLGAAAGVNTMTATVTGVAPATIIAAGVPQQYNIEVRFLTAVSAGAQAAFDSAEARWERILYGELPDVPTGNRPPGTCAGIAVPAMNEIVDDLLIFVRLDSIDGPLNQLGGAGPCLIRSTDSIPLVGAMRFDTADVATFVGQGLFDEIVMHEMGHVIGVGALWDFKDKIVNPSLPSSAGVDTHFPQPAAIGAFNSGGGSGYVAGQKVPVDNSAQLGTADAHWRESVLDTELMTGFLDGGVPNQLSAISIASLLDIGYTRANFAAGDAYVVANPLLRAGPPQKIPFGADVYLDALDLVDRTGRVVRTVRAR